MSMESVIAVTGDLRMSWQSGVNSTARHAGDPVTPYLWYCYIFTDNEVIYVKIEARVPIVCTWNWEKN